MEKVDRDLILSIADFNPVLKQLYEEHLKLDEEIERNEAYAAYSSSAQLRQKQLKKAKLQGMDKIMAILKEHRVCDAACQAQ